MSPLRAGLLAIAAVLASAALAIEPPQDPPGAPAKPEAAEQQAEQPEPADQEPAQGEPAPAPAQEPAADDDELPPLPPNAAPVGPSPQRFNPTEKVRADFPVSFPIDI